MPALARMLEWLAARFPESTVFAVRRPGISLLGASPECLLGLDHGLVVADALAGSAPRATCEEADQSLGSALLGDRKELAEHAVVVREILRALEPLCTGLVATHSPSLLRLANVQHLASHVHGRVRPDVGVFELLDRLHPTAAVGGAPRAAALEWLQRHGESDRGWYTGGVGWLDESGGDIWVALRCAVLGDRVASVYAGAGIVAGSEPKQELRETGWKLQAMLEALAID
jgi:isochorismate synthase